MPTRARGRSRGKKKRALYSHTKPAKAIIAVRSIPASLWLTITSQFGSPGNWLPNFVAQRVGVPRQLKRIRDAAFGALNFDKG